MKYYHLMPFFTPPTTNPTILFERQHYVYGAVTKKEIVDRFGHYYAFFWKADDRTGPVTVRFEYQQAQSGANRGKVLVHAMLMLAGGGHSCADVEQLRVESRLFGSVASDTTTYRTLTAIDSAILAD